MKVFKKKNNANFIIYTIVYIAFSALLLAKEYETILVDEVTSIYDGDTFRVNINSYPPIIGERMAIRVSGIDTPELRGKCTQEKTLAREAKQFTVSKLRGAKVIELRNIQRGKYFRIVADVYVDNDNLANMLIKNNLGVPYNGGTKTKDWCK